MSQLSTTLAVAGSDERRGVDSNPHHGRRWLILVFLGLAQLMVVLDATVVNIALPSVQLDLGFSNESRQWVVTAYALAFGSLLLLGGRLADVFGRKRMFLVGLAGFAGASAIGGVALNFEMLVIARAAQGVFGALLAPAALSLLTTTFTDIKERGRAFGIYGAIAGGGAAVGLMLGGALTDYLNWRWTMFVNIIFAIAALLGGSALLHHHGPSVNRPKLDIPGTVAASAGLFALVYGFANAGTDPWSASSVWGFLTAGVALLGIFIALQIKVAHPLLPMRVLLDRNRGGAFLAVFMSGIGMFAAFLFLTYYLQQNLGFSPIISGLAFLPMVGALMISATGSSSILLPKIGSKLLVGLGMFLSAAGMLWLSKLDVSSTYANGVLFPLLVFGVGLGLTMAPAMSTATMGVHVSDAGVASATVNTAQQVGGSIGIALLSTLAANAATSFTAGKPSSDQLLTAATVHSYTTAFGWAAGIFALGAIICGLLIRMGKPHQEPSEVAVHM